ncbi:MAG TPA: class I SAM-dependent methyltransferase [Candidatus Acidoferrales bacterium]|nr:class I SAM-dependent methyltransferase [Candidatus Acidoferrales bacterium]
MLGTTTNAGLHDFVVEAVLPRLAVRGARAVDLGAGTGELAARLRGLGCDVLAVDLNRKGYGADVQFVEQDLNQSNFAESLGLKKFDLVTAIEVLEHIESPIGFLRSIGQLLKPKGVAVLTTPNVDSTPARVKFLLRGTIRMMDAESEPTHISPIFWDLLQRQYLPRSGMRLMEHYLFPACGFQLTRARYGWAMRGLSLFLGGECLTGDNHVLVLERRGTGE